MSLFRKSLQDLIKGIRNPRNDAAEFTSTAIVSIKKELKSMDIAVKAGAVSKLTYLKMLDFDISWADFNIVELMSAPRFSHKRIGYARGGVKKKRGERESRKSRESKEQSAGDIERAHRTRAPGWGRVLWIWGESCAIV